MTRRRAVFGTLAVTALVLLLGRWGSQQYTDALWYQSLGALDVWRARFVNGMALRLGSFLAATVTVVVPDPEPPSLSVTVRRRVTVPAAA